MKGKNSWKWLVGLGLAITICTSSFAQDHGDHRGKPHRGGRDRSHYSRSEKRDFTARVYHITNADSAQKVKMKPVLDKTNKRMESLRTNYQKQEKRVLDSLNLQLKPYLKEDQLKKLQEWKDKRDDRSK